MALVFGAAGALTVVVVAAVLGGVRDWTVATLTSGSWVLPVAPGALGGAASGWVGADRFGEPAPLASGTVHPDVGRGVAVALWGFILGCAAAPVLLAVAVRADAFGTAPDVSLVAVVEVAGGLVSSFLIAVAVGSFTLFPVALVLGGLTGWLVGRTLGTGAAAGR